LHAPRAENKDQLMIAEALELAMEDNQAVAHVSEA
jgi:hypothetical protein